MAKVSVIIPSRFEHFLQRTIDDLLEKAEGDIEIIVVMDGTDQTVNEHPKVRVLRHGTMGDNFGLRDSVNYGVREATGEYILKADGHTMWDHGFDVKLVEDCKDDWVVIPRRWRLDPEAWDLTTNTEGDRRHL